MSVGSGLLKTAIGVALIAGIGSNLQNMYSANSQLDSNKAAIRELKQQYKIEQTKKPSKKQVTTEYQKAMNQANYLKNLLYELHATQGLDNKGQGVNHVLEKIHRILVNPADIQQSLIPYNINNWHIKVGYGGENSNDQIVMSYKFYDDQNNQTMLVIFNYNVLSNKISGVNSYQTKIGRQQMLKASKA